MGALATHTVTTQLVTQFVPLRELARETGSKVGAIALLTVDAGGCSIAWPYDLIATACLFCREQDNVRFAAV